MKKTFFFFINNAWPFIRKTAWPLTKRILTSRILHYLVITLCVTGYFSVLDELNDQKVSAQEMAHLINEQQIDNEHYYLAIMGISKMLASQEKLDSNTLKDFKLFQQNGWPIKPKPWRQFKNSFAPRILELARQND